MQISSLLTAATAARAAASGQAQAVTERPKPGDDPLLLRQQQAEDALAAARSIAADRPAEQKASAAKTLADAKAELQELMLWISDPEVLARLTQQLAAKVGQAAARFSAGMAAQAGAAASSAAATASATAVVAAGETNETKPETPQVTTFAQRAYQEMSGDAPDERSDDDRTVDAFKSVARQIKALLEKAQREMDGEKAAGEKDAIDRSIASLDASTGMLAASSPSPFPAAGPTSGAIPLSITI